MRRGKRRRIRRETLSTLIMKTERMERTPQVNPQTQQKAGVEKRVPCLLLAREESDMAPRVRQTTASTRVISVYTLLK